MKQKSSTFRKGAPVKMAVEVTWCRWSSLVLAYTVIGDPEKHHSLYGLPFQYMIGRLPKDGEVFMVTIEELDQPKKKKNI